MIRSLITISLLAPLTFLTYADTLKSVHEAKQLSDKFMTYVAKGDIDGAFNAMKPFMVIPETEIQGTALQMKAQLDQFGGRFGNSIGYESISECKAGESILRLIYVQKTEKHALPWVFVFYKSGNGWVMNTATWSDRIVNAFQPC